MTRRVFIGACAGGGLAFSATDISHPKEDNSLVRSRYLYKGDTSHCYMFLTPNEWYRMWDSLPYQHRLIEDGSPMAKNHVALSFKVCGICYLWCQPNGRHYPWVQEIIQSGKLKGYGGYRFEAMAI